jgi:hydrogenase-4 component B
MRFAMAVLASACVALGVASFAAVPMLGRVVAGLGGLPDTQATFTLGLHLQSPTSFGQMSPVFIACGQLLLTALVPALLWLFGVNRRRRAADSWGCGRVGQTVRMEYTATAFAEPLRRVFSEIYRPMRELTVHFHPGSKYFVASIKYRSEITPLFEQSMYKPFLDSANFVAEQVRRLQAGSLHLYLLYMAAALAVLIFVARWWQP